MSSQKLSYFSQFTEAETDKCNHRMIIKGTLRNCSYAIRDDETKRVWLFAHFIKNKYTQYSLSKPNKSQYRLSKQKFIKPRSTTSHNGL